ncbi:4'-phosphopantetheinyl transferase superfamily protein [Streptomyces sp. NPDC051211]|uniref:4'-phosphopantetheinyl transferase family protein n=1 Tax=Streptomyces sp. NPDC051211 TaxID=3154643 RepID=UPI00344DCC7C
MSGHRPGAPGGTAEAAGVLENAPLHVHGPDGPWDEVAERLDDTGRVVVCTTWGEWLTAALLDPGLRPLLGHDWPRYRQTSGAAGRLRFAVSRFVMKHTAATALGVPVGTLDLGYQPGGRPVLRGLTGDADISLTHTDDLVVVGVSRTGPIGVDAETADRRISFDLLHEHVCTDAEAAYLAALPEPERGAKMLRLWTLKEAYTKALGHGLRRRFSAFGFACDGTGRNVLAPGPDMDPELAAQEGWSFATHVVEDRYLVSEAHRRLR